MSQPAFRVPGAARRVIKCAAAALLSLLVVTCTDNPVGPGRPGLGSLRVAPTFGAFARNAPLTLDNVRVIVVRPPSDTLANVARSFSVSSSQLTLNIPLQLQAASEDLEVTLELYAGTTLLFSGTRIVRVAQGLSPAPDSVPVVYQGPGATIAAITIGPRDTTVVFGGSFLFGATAIDSQQAPVVSFYVGWTASAGTIDAAGQFTAPAARDTVTVTATTPSGITDQTTVIVAAAPATLVKVSGDNQSGIIGSALPLPLVVRVDGSDGLPVAGVPVTFAATTGGGSVDSATVVSNGAGLATMGATLGGTVGAQSFTATAPGLTAVVFAATGTGGAAKTWTGAVSGDWNTAGNWSPAAVPVTTDSVAIPAGTPNGPVLAGSATIRTLVLQGTGSGLDVTGNLTVSGLVSLPDTNSFIDVPTGQFSAGSVSLGGFQAFIDASGGLATVGGTISLTGNRAFFEGGPGSALGPVSITGAQAFVSHYGGTQGPVTASGTAAFWEAGGAVTITGTPAVQLAGTAFVSSFGGPAVVTINGDVTVGGTGAFFDVSGGDHFTVNGNLQTTGGGYLQMTQATDTVEVNGNISFGGGDESGRLIAGMLFVSGNFSQTGGATSFVGSGSHTVFLDGAGAQTLNFASPGFAASRFHNVIIANSAGGVTATSDLYATGTAGVTPTAVRTLSGNGSTLFTTILNVSNFTFNNLLLNFSGSTVVTFDTVTFAGYAPTATPLTIAHPGAAAPLPFLDVSFSVVPTSGFYISATDTNPTDGVPLVIDMVSPSPADPAGRVQTAGGATINWSGAAPVITWTGAVDTDWGTAGNWSPAQVPIATSDVIIPAGTPNDPTLSSSVTVANLTVQAGAVLSLGDVQLTVTGALDASGSVTGCCSDQVEVQGTVRGNFTDVLLFVNTGQVATLNGPVTLTNSGVQLFGELILGGNTLNVGQGSVFIGNGTGLLTMTNPADVLTAGTVDFSGGDETGRLTAGTIQTQSLFQGSAGGQHPASFFAGGNHRVVLGGPSSSVVTFANPATSRFQQLDVSGVSATLTLGSNVTVAGQLVAVLPTGSGPVVNGAGFTLTAGGADIGATGGNTALTFDGVPLVLSGGAITGVSHLTFQNQNPNGTALTVNNVGTPAAFIFSNLTFTTALSAGGFHLVANDLDGLNPDPLTIDVLASSPATGTGVSQATNGAVINWPPTGSTFTWTGSVSQDWFNPGNWDLGSVPGVIDNIILVPITNQPVLTNNAAVNNVTSTAGSILDLGTFVLVAGGTVDLAGTINGGAGSGVSVTGTGQLLRGTINTDLAVVGSYVLNGNLILSGNLSVNGTLDISSFTAQVGGSFVTLGSGVLVMTTTGGLLDVTGDAIFGGGSTAGLLTAGVLRITGDFIQLATTSPASFAADPGHVTELSADPANITFSTPGVNGSHFGDLAESGYGAQFILNSDVTILGFLSGGDGFGGNFLGSSCPVTLTVTRWDNSVTLDCVRLVLDDPAGNATGMSDATFVNLPTDVTQLTIRHPGTAAGNFSTGTLNFVPLTGGDPGLYIDATDLDASPPFLVVDIFNSNVLNGASFTATAGGASVFWQNGTVTWTGAVDNNWFQPGNWDQLNVPGFADSVVVPLTANQPSLTGNIFVGALNITGGTLTVNGNTVNVARNFATTGTGTVTMTSVFSLMIISGDALFGGGSTNGLLTAGEIVVGGNFTQDATTSVTSYAPSGSHRTTVGSANPGTISFASPGAGAAGSHFMNLNLNNATGGVTLGVNTIVDNALESSNPAALLVGGGNSLTARIWSVSGLMVDNAPMILDEGGTGSAQAFDNVTFQGFPTTATAAVLMDVTAVGSALANRPITFNNLTVQTSLGAGGLYARLTSSNGFGVTLTINGSNDPTGGPSRSDPPFGTIVAGARILWQ